MKKIYVLFAVTFLIVAALVSGCADHEQELREKAPNIIISKLNEHVEENSSALHFKTADNEIFTISTGEIFNDLNERNFYQHQTVSFYRQYNAIIVKLDLVDVQYDFQSSDKCSVSFEIKETKKFLSQINGIKIHAVLPSDYSQMGYQARESFKDKYYSLLLDHKFDYNHIYNSAAALEVNTLKFSVSFKYDDKEKKWVSRKYNLYQQLDTREPDFLNSAYESPGIANSLTAAGFKRYGDHYLLPESIEILEKLASGLMYHDNKWIARKTYDDDNILKKRIENLDNAENIDQLLSMSKDTLDFIKNSACSEGNKKDAVRRINKSLTYAISNLSGTDTNKFISKANIVIKFIKNNKDSLPENLQQNLNGAIGNYISRLSDKDSEKFIIKADAMLKFLDDNQDIVSPDMYMNLSNAISSHIRATKYVRDCEIIYSKIKSSDDWNKLGREKHLNEICSELVEHYVVTMEKSGENFFENSEKCLLYMKDLNESADVKTFTNQLIALTEKYRDEVIGLQTITGTIIAKCRYADAQTKWEHFESFEKSYKKIYGEKMDWKGVPPLQQIFFISLYLYLTPEEKYDVSENFLFTDNLTKDFFMKCLNTNCRNGKYYCKTCKNSKVCRNCNGSGWTYTSSVDGGRREISCSRTCQSCKNKPENCPGCFGRGYRLKTSVWQTKILPRYKEFYNLLQVEVNKYNKFLNELKDISSKY